MKLEFNLNNNVEMPEIILGKRNYDKLGSIVNLDNLTYEYNLMSADSISFTVYKELNCEKERLWDEIKDRRLIYLKEFDEWFQINVATNDENGATKEITGTSLCEAELSQIYIKSTEINTENDIARPEYINPTVFYKPSNPNESLLHRLLKVVPNYTIKHVDETLYNLQRIFSIDGSTVYDTLTGEIAGEIGCLFLFDSTDRSIYVYDLKTNCNHCGYRADYTDICPECNSTDLSYGYGNDTTILVDSETLSDRISLSGKQDEVKNYIKVSGGDDIINTAISACNPTGTQYIYAFSDSDKEDMSDGLSSKLKEYLTEYNRLTPDYQDIMADLYSASSEKHYLESAMMPDIVIPETNAQKELAKLTAENLNPIAVQDVSTASVYTVNNAVLGMAQCIVNSTVYKIELVENSTSFVNQTWKGKFKLINYSSEDDSAESTQYITLTVNDDQGHYIEQKIRKKINRDDIYLDDIFDAKTDLEVFKAELKKYCLNRLNSFISAYRSVTDILTTENYANASTYGDIYNELYLPYYNRLTAIEKEYNVRCSEIKAVEAKISDLEKARAEITGYLNLENFLGDTLWKELCSFRREGSFENSNYISDGLDNSELLSKANDLLEKAKIEAVTASTLQMSLSATMFNLLAIPEFQKLTGMFEGGNWIRVRVDDRIYRLRLIHYKISFSELQNIEVEFSDVTQTSNGLNDAKSLMEKVSSIATNFSYVAHQAEQGAKGFTELNTIKNDGLNAALYNVSTGVNQDFKIDEHGITGRQWDDILGDYLPEQVKFTNNCLVYTDDYWQTAKAALGKIQYYNPILKGTVSQYGLIADAVVSGILMGNDIIGGDIYSENYSSTAGTHIDLNNGDFSFAGGKLKYNSESNVLNLTGKITFESIDYSSNSVKTSVKDSLGITAAENNIASINSDIISINKDISDSNSTIAKLKRCLGYTTEISSDYVISPYIGGGYLNISNNSYGAVIIDPSNIKNSGYIFGVYNSSNSLVMGVDTSGNGVFKGNVSTSNIIATGGSIAGYTISNNQLISSITSDSSSAYISMNSNYTGSDGYKYSKQVQLTHNGTNCNVTKVFDSSSGMISLDAYNTYITDIKYGINGISAYLHAEDSNYGENPFYGNSSILFKFYDYSMGNGKLCNAVDITSGQIFLCGNHHGLSGRDNCININGGLTVSNGGSNIADLYVLGSTEITGTLVMDDSANVRVAKTFTSGTITIKMPYNTSAYGGIEDFVEILFAAAGYGSVLSFVSINPNSTTKTASLLSMVNGQEISGYYCSISSELYSDDGIATIKITLSSNCRLCKIIYTQNATIVS